MIKLLCILVAFLAGFYLGLSQVPQLQPVPLLPKSARRLKCPDPTYEDRRLLKECQEFVLSCIVKVSRASEGLEDCSNRIIHQEEELTKLKQTL